MPNRLASQASPYLLQHKNNPVDWWPWGPEAFAEARRREVPVFLSIGYSTCYWCHVMERESFENREIAERLNRDFLPIKVDREERPDLDELYMAATISMNGHGGWPMSLFLEPRSLKPFYCGTYFPPEERPHYGRPSFPQLLAAMRHAWTTQRDGVIEQADQVAHAVAEHLAPSRLPVRLGREQVTDALSGLLRSFDDARGGFGAAPKFPQPSNLDFLLQVRSLASDQTTRDAVDHALTVTLSAMACGGIFDQIGGGFHRYSVDASWTVPHFEKMLYDNALLASTYTKAFRASGDLLFARTADRIGDYLLREMRDPSTGLFFSAQDAEVDHREGLNYLWNPDQVRDALASSPEHLELALSVYGLDGPANFQDPHHPPRSEADRTWVLRLKDRPDRLAAARGLDLDEFLHRLDAVNAALLAVRGTRRQPATDDKCIAAWNGLAIAALADAGYSLDRPDFFEAAEHAATSLLGLLLVNGRLHRSVCRGVLGPAGVLEDYAMTIRGLIALAHPSNEARRDRHLADAAMLLDELEKRFVSPSGLVHDTGQDATDLFLRATSTHDGALPSGFSTYLWCLLDLFRITGDRRRLDAALRTLAAHSGAIHASPLSTINATGALLKLLTLDDSAGARLGDAPAGPTATTPRTAREVDPVEILAAAERVTLTPEEPHATFALRVHIADGWHIADSTATNHPFRLSIINGTGVKVYADYPATSGVISIAGADTLPIYEGTLEFSIVLELEESTPRTGQPLIAVSYQACTLTECLEPTIVELDIAIDA